MNTILFLLLSFVLPVNQIDDVMLEFHNLKSEKNELDFIKRHSKKLSPSIQAYVIGLQLRQAKYGFNIVRKIAIYNNHNNKLNHLVANHPNNVHARYIRLVVQENVPKILSCFELIKEDKLFLKKYISMHKNSQLVQYIKLNTTL